MSSKTDLMYEIVYNPKFVPLPSPKVNVKTTIVGSKPSYLMKNHVNNTYYDLDELTNQVWSFIDGKRTVKQIIKEILRQNPKIQERNILGTLLFFAESNLLVANLELPPKKRFKVVSAFEIDFCLIKRSKDFLQSLHNKIKPALKKSLLYVSIVFTVVSFLFFVSEFISIYGQKANFEILGSSVVGFFFYNFAALGPVIAIHEISHGLALVHYGAQPGEMGTGLFYFSPMFYIDTSDAWGLSRFERIMVYLAGNISTLLIGSALVVVHFTVAIPDPYSHILKMAAFYCFLISLFNFAPPFETDGYYMLSDIVNIPNLRQDAYSYLGSTVKRAFNKNVKRKPQNLTNHKKRILLVYAVISATWIVYIVFQSSLFLVYMGQDVVFSLTSIGQTVLSSQALSASVLIVTVASTFYFGMQVIGYGYVFSAAVKKATAKPLQIEAIHDRDLAVFTYLPSKAPDALSSSLKAKMEKAAAKFTTNFETQKMVNSWTTVLRMGGTSLALVQIKEHLKKIENEFREAYQDFIKQSKEALQSSIGTHAPHKIKLTKMLDRLATESAEMGNSTALSIVRLYEEKQNEILMYLLSSAFGTIWTIELQPSQEYSFGKELCPDLLLEDLTFTDLYNDTENFKKSTIYGFDSLAKLAEEIDVGLKECMSRPDKYQLISILEPIKSRIVFVGRTEKLEEHIQTMAPLFIIQTWSGYLDNLLSETCLALSTINKSSLPNPKEVAKMSTGELALLRKDLLEFTEIQKSVDKCIEDSKTHLTKSYQSLKQLETTIKSLESFDIGLIDSVFNVNIENLENLPHRIRDFEKEWKMLCKRIERVHEHAEKSYHERKPDIARKKKRMLKIYPFIAAFSTILIVLSFHPSLTNWWIALLSIALIPQVFYLGAFCRVWKSFHKATKYASGAFKTTHLFILALAKAIYGYVITEDILTPLDNGTKKE